MATGRQTRGLSSSSLSNSLPASFPKLCYQWPALSSSSLSSLDLKRRSSRVMSSTAGLGPETQPGGWSQMVGHGGGAVRRIVSKFLVAKKSYNSTLQNSNYETMGNHRMALSSRSRSYTQRLSLSLVGQIVKKTAKFNGEYQKYCTSNAKQLKGNAYRCSSE